MRTQFQFAARQVGFLALLGSLALGCAGHAGRTKGALEALDAGNPKLALASINAELEVESAKDLPTDVRGDQALLLMDRAVILQQLGDHALSARDLEIADKQVEMMDFSRSTMDDIGRFLFSDDTGAYKAPPYEKLMLNTMNMLNYLVMGNLSGGRVEARRFAVMQKYLRENVQAGADLLGPGSYFAGFIFEKSQDPKTAILYYDEALRATEFRSLEDTVVDLASGMPRPPDNIKKVLEARSKGGSSSRAGTSASLAGSTATAADSPPPTSAAAMTSPAELLVVVNYGRVPAKKAVRLPIGLALAHAGHALPPHQRILAQKHAAAKSAVTWVNFPILSDPKPIPYDATVKLDAEPVAVDTVSVDDLVVSAWNSAKPALIASAITRAVTRAVTGEAVEQVGGTWGAIVSLLGQAAAVAADTPDTRSWATLPARISVARIKVKPGKHRISIGAGNARRDYSVDVAPGGWKALAFTVLN